MNARLFALNAIAISVLTACGGGGGGATASTSSTSVPVMLSDAASEDWSQIQVSVLSLTLTDTTGAVTSVPLPTSPYVVNLVQLDNLSEVLSAAQLTPGTTYTKVTLTISANPGDVVLTPSQDPQSGFPAVPPGVPLASSSLQIQGATGAAGSKTVTIPITLATPYTVPAAGSTVTPLNLEFDLSNAAFIVAHNPLGGGNLKWAVNFRGPVTHKRIPDITQLVLRHSYGSVTSVSSDNLTLNINRDVPTYPIVSPETAVTTAQALAVKADATNGTLFYDVDGHHVTTIHDFSSVSSLLTAGEYVRVAARYQQDGSLVATRIWASSTFNGVFISPEGHVLHVDNANGASFTVENAQGAPTTIDVNASTKFYFRNPGTAADVVPIGTGPSFLTSSNLVRGFKVRVTPVDVLASPIVAASVDIEAAPYEGVASNINTTGFTLTHTYQDGLNGYTNLPLNYIGSTTANGKDPLTGAAITGFKYWDFAYPTLVTSGPGAVASFVTATTAPSSPVSALTYATWPNTGSSNTWIAPFAILIPTSLGNTFVHSAVSGNAFSVASTGAPTTVNFSTTPGSATLAYQVDRTGEVVTVTPQDITTPAGLAALTTGLAVGNKVTVSAVPQASGGMLAYTITYFTGTQSIQ